MNRIGLETLRMVPNARGIPVDAHMRAGGRVWAVGDVTGIWPLTHVGTYQARIAAANILGEPREADYEAVPRVTFTDPQAAAVGATEDAFSATVRLSSIARTATYTRASPESDGYLTLLSDGECLTGAHALGPEPGEWLQQATLAIRASVPLEDLGDTIQPFPTFSEIYLAGVQGLHSEIATARRVGRAEIAARTIVWAAGVTASRLASALAELTGAEQDRAGRATVEPDLTLPGHPEVFALGDMVRVRDRDGTAITLPGVAPVAMQQGRYAAKAVRSRLQGRTPPPIRYRDKGNLATIGRGAAVADIQGFKLSGFLAGITWLVVHLFCLVGFQNRLLVLIRWSISFATRDRGARLITDPADAEAPGSPMAHSGPETALSVPPSEVSPLSQIR